MYNLLLSLSRHLLHLITFAGKFADCTLDLKVARLQAFGSWNQTKQRVGLSGLLYL